MSIGLDTSVLVGALLASSDRHHACRELLLKGGAKVHSHAFAELFSTLTGGRLPLRTTPDEAADLIRHQVAVRVAPIELSTVEILALLQGAQARGVRGGAVYDFLHLGAAAKAGVTTFYTLNLADFRSMWRPGDLEIAEP